MLCLALAAGSGAAAAAPAGRTGHSYVVVYSKERSARTATTASATTSRLGRRLGFRPRLRYRRALSGFAARLGAHQVAALRRDPRVALVFRDRVLRASGHVAVAAGEQVPTGVSRIGAVTADTAHEASTAGVAVIDTGIDLSAGSQMNVHAGTNCINPGQPPDDDDGHGTFVAGVIAARNDGNGVIGVAPGTPVWAVKTLDYKGEGDVSSIICGIDWVTANARSLGIRVANLSLGAELGRSGCGDEPLHLAICNSTAAGVTYVVAAGNDGADAGAFPAEVPAIYPEVLTVTAMSDGDGAPGAQFNPDTYCLDGLGPPEEGDDTFATFSNYATQPQDAAHFIAAPGTCITSAGRFGGEETGSGTSAAAPHVSGVVALCAGEAGGEGACAGMTPAEVIQQVRADAAFRAGAGGGFLGDPDHPVGAYFGYLASAIEPGIRRLPFPPPNVPPAQAADRSVALRRLSAARSQSLARLRVTVLLDEAGSASATATVRSGRHVYRLRSSTKRLKGGRAASLRLSRPASRLRKLRRAMAAGTTGAAAITVRLRDAAGNALVKHRRVRLRR
jgi:subtilisin